MYRDLIAHDAAVSQSKWTRTDVREVASFSTQRRVYGSRFIAEEDFVSVRP